MKKLVAIFFEVLFVITIGLALTAFGQNLSGSGANLPANVSQQQIEQAIQNNPQFQNLSPEEIQKGLKILKSGKAQQIKGSKLNLSSNPNVKSSNNKSTSNTHYTKTTNGSGLFGVYLKNSSGALNVSLKNLKPYGYSLFRQKPGKPLFIQPVPPNYVIGPGDEIQVILWGRINAQYNLKVGADGKIFFPNIGPLMVSGMTYSKMQSFLEEQAKRITGTNVSITLNGLHQIQVFVLGEVKKPGLYNLPAMSTILNALMACGGPTTRGTLRRIELKRHNKVVDVLDIYNVLMNGNRSHDWILRNNDVVFVPLVGPLVGVAGNVRRPGIYELKKSTSLKGVIKMAGGLLPNALSQVIQVVRFENHKWKVVEDINYSNAKEMTNFKVRDGDIVKVFSVITQPINPIYLVGNVLHPGTYSYYPGIKLSDLIKSNNDLLPGTYFKYALIKRYIPKTGRFKLIPFSLNKLLEKKFDIDLMPWDTIYIFPTSMFVQEPAYSIFGEVRHPGTYKSWNENFRVRDLIMKAGGLKKDAFLKDAQIVSYKLLDNGTLVKTSTKNINLSLAMEGNGRNNILLKPFDNVFVRKIPGWGNVVKVKIEGEVKFPGTYVLPKGARLSDLIMEAGGYKDDAYLQGAEYFSPSAQRIQQQALKDLVNKLQSEIYLSAGEMSQKSLSTEETQSAKVQLMSAERFLSTLKRLKAKGRVVIRLAPVRMLENTPYDLQLENDSTLIIPREKDMINVVGSVMSPSSFIYSPNFTWKDYIKMAGGYTRFADESNVFVIRCDGSAYKVSKGPIKWNPFKSRWEITAFNKKSKLEPGDTIVVPMKVQYIPWLRNVKDITQILMQVAVTTGIVLRLY